jgi:peptidoglycan hydrolase CwlO-like protein
MQSGTSKFVSNIVPLNIQTSISGQGVQQVVQKNITALEASVSTIQGTVTSLQSSISSVQKTVTALQTRITAIETRLG